MGLLNAKRAAANVGGKEIILETGRVARQANGAVWVQCGGTVALVTVCEAALDAPKSFFPLTVEYAERMYAAGRIPGNFFRREIGRPSDHETLVARLIDRPIRPLFPKTYPSEVQVLATVISADGENDPDVLCITAASAATCISSIPFDGPVAGARLGRVDGQFVLNPTHEELSRSDMDIVLAASRDAVVMVEGECKLVSEQDFIDGLNWAHKAMQPLIDAQEELIRLAGKEKTPFEPKQDDPELFAYVEELAVKSGMEDALRTPDKLLRKEARNAVKAKVKALMAEDERYAGDPEAQAAIGDVLEHLEKKLVRQRVISEGTRIDNRDTQTVRPIEIEMAVLPRAHGSAIFARGETKTIAVTTLGSSTDEQQVDSLRGEEFKRFMLHYNFPPFTVGEVKPVRVSRREIGHGHLAERALKAVLPSAEEFPYTIRVVSDTVESNGSSSMAAVCGGCLSLMDAGVPISAPVAGVAMGLIKDGETYTVLTDILGDEDALGDMDFKIAGTADGISAIQMDIKINGLPTEVMARALAQARAARLHVLDVMAKAMPAVRDGLSPYAPQHMEVFVDPEVIRMIIGPGGKNIKAITSSTGASIDIEDSGRVTIFAPTQESLMAAKEMVLYYDQHAELGKNYNAKVKRVMEIGAIVELLPNVEALVHISQLDTGRVEKTEDVAHPGEDMMVKVIEINGDRIRASRKAVLLEAQGIEWKPEDTTRPAPRPRGDRPQDGERRSERRGERRDRGDRRGDRRERRDS
ncbi:MAG: polyribonucleotide nucleotidyltransferase [Desulfovibrio sp.]|nr:polyribonucleotide nucleotidyltransferase [Mailhella sp.]